MSNKIELKSISELSEMKFFIPDYQRGYRWTIQQVKDLLDDIDEFIKKKQSGFYCIQPLVIKKNIFKEAEYCDELKKLNSSDKDRLIDKTEKILSDYSRWEVIDGQQRLTTIYILLSYLNPNIERYKIEYETQKGSDSFLTDIESKRKNENIDYYHIVKAYQQIKAWFRCRKMDQEKFLSTLLDDVKFICYESVDENPIKVFTRLNIGKISLTNSELIKALFLNKSNFKDDDYQKIRLKQQEISGDWDNIENSLQNDELWLFINELSYDKPTRIDFIFDLVCKKNILQLSDDEIKKTGDDEYQTFRYFYAWFNKGEDVDITKCWGEVKTLFQTINEWFNDLELYHYIGFLVGRFWGEDGIDSVSTILDKWKIANSKKVFIDDYIFNKIKRSLSNCSDIEKQYEESDSPKRQCRPLLLLYNLQTVITQNQTLTKNEKYKQPVFYKFPFHLFKKEKWDVEHIDSNTENELETIKEKREWLMASLFIAEGALKTKIQEFLNKDYQDGEDAHCEFSKLCEEISSEPTDKLERQDKDRLWNFTLLDRSTNRGYGNSIFSAKRRVIIGKDQGKIIEVNDNYELEEKEGAIAFIPPCTRNVFLKYYNPSVSNLREWNKTDAKAYQQNISNILKEFLPINNETNAE